MKLWMGAEIQNDVGADYAAARKELEFTINQSIATQDYGPGLVKWYFIAIIRKIDSPDYGEIQKYIKSKKEVEFRKKINYPAFKATDAVGQRNSYFRPSRKLLV